MIKLRRGSMAEFVYGFCGSMAVLVLLLITGSWLWSQWSGTGWHFPALARNMFQCMLAVAVIGGLTMALDHDE